jgi:hypothetical protein
VSSSACGQWPRRRRCPAGTGSLRGPSRRCAVPARRGQPQRPGSRPAARRQNRARR